MTTISNSVIENLIINGEIGDFLKIDLQIGYKQIEMMFIDINKKEIFKYVNVNNSKTISFIGVCNNPQMLIH